MESFTLWVCTNCLHHLANGECGECHEDKHEGGEPCSLLSARVSIGMNWDEHSCIEHEYCDEDEGCECQPVEDCDCENITFSTMACNGCGSQYYGERHAVTEWVTNG